MSPFASQITQINPIRSEFILKLALSVQSADEKFMMTQRLLLCYSLNEYGLSALACPRLLLGEALITNSNTPPSVMSL